MTGHDVFEEAQLAMEEMATKDFVRDELRDLLKEILDDRRRD